MLVINGKKYAKNDKEFVETLFDTEGTAYGYYKVKRNGVLLLDMQKQPFAFVVNQRGECFAVSCGKYGNKIRYCHDLTSADERILGFDCIPYGMQRDACLKICERAKGE